MRSRFNCVLSILSYLCKAPLVPHGTPVVNSLFRQRACIDNVLRACVGLAPISHMMLEHKHERIQQQLQQPQQQPILNGQCAASDDDVIVPEATGATPRKAAGGRLVPVNCALNGQA